MTDASSPDDYLLHTQPWQSQTGDGPLLRGRRRDGAGPLLHFLHGNGLCGGVYWPMLRRLGEHGLFCHDYEGHGASERPAQFSGTRALIRRIPQIIDEQIGAQPLIGIGHSFGGALSLRVAAAHPQRFRALVLLDPILLPPSAYFGLRLAATLRLNPMSRAARRRRAHWPTREAAYRHLHQRGIYRGWSDEAFAAFIEYAMREAADGGCELSCPGALEGAIFDHPVYPWRALPKLRCPTLILYGQDSYGFMAGAMRRAAHSNPLLQVEALPGGHCFMLEDPETSAARIRAFLAQHTP
ncbi:Pimeloyl-ACP methyl ester carboxylesterase [Solimonas aquatica]|uniref:Pimeloyl-ACP methyl ester carboxylesterase n=1 Tax=Solimonas aquatica TaxID=489703 RepID=A0A1H9CQU7_9GAMM|nr:Pimeloyl-ACP methyl ester carboxylesterase [Solimonas aquatica]